jgi:novel plant SNARE
LKAQGEKLKEVEEGLETIESNLKRADKQMRIFIRKLAGDKIFMMMIFLIVIGIVGAIAFSVLKRQCPSSVASCICALKSGIGCTPA